MDLEKAMRGAVAPRPKVARPIVLIGAGGIVHDAHLPAYAKAGFPVAAVVDLNREKAEALAEKFGIPLATTSLRGDTGMPGGCGVRCAVPAPADCGGAGAASGWGGGADSEADGRDAGGGGGDFAICRRKGLTAAINFQLRWAPNMLAARALHGTGALGELHDMEVTVSCICRGSFGVF